MKKRSSTIIITAVITAVITAFLTVFIFAAANRNNIAFFSRLRQVSSLIEKHAIFDFSSDAADDLAVRGYLSALDDGYTAFWNEEEYKAYLSETEGNFSGIGIVLQSTDPVSDGLFIYQVKGNSPAQAAGLKAGDLIVAVNGNSVIDRSYDEVYQEISSSGDSDFSLTVQREEETLTFSLAQANFVQNYVSGRAIGNIGFIRIDSFMPPSANEFQSVLNDLLEQGVKGFVFDLRNNLGGSLDAVVSILDLLIPEDEMVILQYKNSEQIIRSTGRQKTDLPMVVLINESSASASELMASCLRDVNGSLLIGRQSFGKGIGQTTFTLTDGSAVKMTTFYYLTKARNHYHGIGLEPDIAVELSEAQSKYFYTLDESNDPQLQAALTALSEQIPD